MYIKQDPTLIIVFKYQALWDNLNHNTTVTACTQDDEDIFHKSYILSTPDNMDLSKECFYM